MTDVQLLPVQKASAKTRLPADWYDGGIVILNEKGAPDFAALQQSFDELKTKYMVAQRTDPLSTVDGGFRK